MDPAVPQLSSVTSESLQATIRRLLPSQQGFGVELAASNVITPIIDLTPSAEGSSVPEFMQRAMTLNSVTTMNVQNAVTTGPATSGFWQIRGCFQLSPNVSTVLTNVKLYLTDGTTNKIIFEMLENSPTTNVSSIDYEEVIFLNTGESAIINASSFSSFIGAYRQIADVNGNLINPAGFTPQ